MVPKVSKLNIFSDERGFFFPLKLSEKWVQSNISNSKKWTFRGLHHQRGASAQAKLVTVITGEILDFIVDLRKESFGQTCFFSLKPGDQLYVPRGFAHGFLALKDDTTIQYLVDNEYSPSEEISFDWKSNSTVRDMIMSIVKDESYLSMSSKDSNGEKITTDWAESLTSLGLKGKQ